MDELLLEMLIDIEAIHSAHKHIYLLPIQHLPRAYIVAKLSTEKYDKSYQSARESDEISMRNRFQSKEEKDWAMQPKKHLRLGTSNSFPQVPSVIKIQREDFLPWRWNLPFRPHLHPLGNKFHGEQFFVRLRVCPYERLCHWIRRRSHWS